MQMTRWQNNKEDVPAKKHLQSNCLRRLRAMWKRKGLGKAREWSQWRGGRDGKERWRKWGKDKGDATSERTPTFALQKGGKVWVGRRWAMKEHRGEVAEKIPFRREQELTNIYGSKRTDDEMLMKKKAARNRRSWLNRLG